MNLRFLETFVWVARLRSFTAAANKVHATQAAVSERIAALERDFGVKLFERGKRDVSLTDAGQVVLAEAEIILQRYVRLKARLAADDDTSGQVRLSVSGSIVHSFLPDLLERLQRDLPKVSVDVITSGSSLKAVNGLLKNSIDLALLMGPVMHEGVVNLDLCHFGTRWMASPELVGEVEPMDVAELSRFPILSFSADSLPHRYVEDCFQHVDPEDLRIYPSQSLALSIRLAVNGRGVAMLPPATVSEELKSGALRILPIRQEPPALNFTASTLDRRDQALPLRVAHLACELAAEFCERTDAAYAWR